MSPNTSWTLTPGALVVLGLALGAYVIRWRRARREEGARAASAWRLASFLAGIIAVLGALISPIDRLSEQLFFAHMVQHVLLLDIAPILIVLGLTKVLLRPLTRRLRGLETGAGPIAHPGFAVALYVGAMWLWHLPVLYDGALRDPALHVIEHLSFAAAGGLYWWHLLSPIRARLRLGGMGPIVYMVSTKLLVGLLGIALAFAPGTLYDFYSSQPRFWGLSAHTDQSLAGLIMALEQSLVMGTALAVLFGRMLSESEREAQRAERYA